MTQMTCTCGHDRAHHTGPGKGCLTSLDPESVCPCSAWKPSTTSDGAGTVLSITAASRLAVRLVAEAGGLMTTGDLLDELIDEGAPIHHAAEGIRRAGAEGRLEHATDEHHRQCVQTTIAQDGP